MLTIPGCALGPFKTKVVPEKDELSLIKEMIPPPPPPLSTPRVGGKLNP